MVLSVDEVTTSANEVTDKAGFIGRENMACLYRELGKSKFGSEGNMERPRVLSYELNMYFIWVMIIREKNLKRVYTD